MNYPDEYQVHVEGIRVGDLPLARWENACVRFGSQKPRMRRSPCRAAFAAGRRVRRRARRPHAIAGTLAQQCHEHFIKMPCTARLAEQRLHTMSKPCAELIAPVSNRLVPADGATGDAGRKTVTAILRFRFRQRAIFRNTDSKTMS
jgi:hypothetical protein